MKTYSNHIVDISVWPLTIGFSLLSIINSIILYLNKGIIGGILLSLSLLTVIITIYLWFNDVVIEATYLGNHTISVTNGLKLGYYIFLLTEIILFVGVFWSWFHGKLSADIILGSEFPPKGIVAINAYILPLVNTIVLLTSASIITYSHHLLITGKYRNKIIISIMFTEFLALLFLMIQYIEYNTGNFSISDSIFGSVFYIATGLHMLHVIAGTAFLIQNNVRIINYHLYKDHHYGLEAAIIYWHLVDVVWLLLWVIVYWY